MNRQQNRAKSRLVRIADARLMRDYGAGVVAVSPDAPQLVLWRHMQKNCKCELVTDSNRATMMRQLNRATDTLTWLLRADWVAYRNNLCAALHRIEQATAATLLRALDTFALDTRPTVRAGVLTTVQASAP
jgi:hypothetical protein